MHQPLPPYLDFDTYLWMEHWNARFTEEDRIRAEMEGILSKGRANNCNDEKVPCQSKRDKSCRRPKRDY